MIKFIHSFIEDTQFFNMYNTDDGFLPRIVDDQPKLMVPNVKQRKVVSIYYDFHSGYPSSDKSFIAVEQYYYFLSSENA